MNGEDVLLQELDYLTLSNDIDMYESASDEGDDDTSKVTRIKAQFNVVSSHLDNTMVYLQNYVDSNNKSKDESDYEKRLKSLILTALKAIDSNNESMSVYDNRSAFEKYNKCKDLMLKELENFVTSRSYDSVDDVISKRDTLLDVIKEYDDGIKDDIELKVWLNPETVKRVCMDALGQGMSFNMDLKSAYMNITRLNNKVSLIIRDGNLDKSVKSELISSSLKLTTKVTSFCISWNKYFVSHYPMVKA